jgi:hypothetical protein
MLSLVLYLNTNTHSTICGYGELEMQTNITERDIMAQWFLIDLPLLLQPSAGRMES